MDLIADGSDFGQVLFGVDLDLNAILLEFSRQQDHGLVEQLGQVHGREVGTAILGHAQDAVGDLGSTLASSQDFLEGLVAGGLILVTDAHFGIVHDRHQDVIEFVCGGTQEFSQRGLVAQLCQLATESGQFFLRGGRVGWKHGVLGGSFKRGRIMGERVAGMAAICA